MSRIDVIRKALAAKTDPDLCHLGMHVFTAHAELGDRCECGWEQYSASRADHAYIQSCRRLIGLPCPCEASA